MRGGSFSARSREIMFLPAVQLAMGLLNALADLFGRLRGLVIVVWVRSLNRVEDLFTMHRNFLGCFNAQANLVSADVHNGDDDIVTDHDAFIAVAG